MVEIGPKNGKTSNWSIFAFIIIIFISYATLPDSLHTYDKPTVKHVWYFGWISALSTGFGVVPLLFTTSLNPYWIGISNGTITFISIIVSHDPYLFFIIYYLLYACFCTSLMTIFTLHKTLKISYCCWNDDSSQLLTNNRRMQFQRAR